MANWYGLARSNYVTALSNQAFKSLVELFNGEYVEKINEDGIVQCGFIANSEDGSTPYRRFFDQDEENAFVNELKTLIDEKHHSSITSLNENGMGISIVDVIHSVLAPDQVLIILEVGHEKARYITGYAYAINASGTVLTRNLEESIMLDVQNEFGGEIALNTTAPAY